MTTPTALKNASERLSKLSDEELTEYLKPCFIFTRPEKVCEQPKKTESGKMSKQDAKEILEELLKGMKKL